MEYNDKESLIEAIKEFDKFNKSQKALLILLIEFAKSDIANISIDSMAKMLGLSKTIIYKGLAKLEKLKFITREKIPEEKVGYIKLNKKEFEQVLEFYAKKIQFLPQKV